MSFAFIVYFVTPLSPDFAARHFTKVEMFFGEAPKLASNATVALLFNEWLEVGSSRDRDRGIEFRNS
jgi:hypothetical protein